MMNNPEVSVIIPAFNCEKTIVSAVESVLFQTISNIEIIIIDDCSNDGTLSLIKQLAAKDRRIQIITNSINHGVAQARNIALSFASGAFVAFLDSDDIWEQEKLSLQLGKLNKTGADLCYTAYGMINSNGSTISVYQVPQKITYFELLKENVIGCSTVLIRKNKLPKNPFKQGYFHEDFALWLYLLRTGKKATGINKPLVGYRTGGRSSNKLKAAYYRWYIYRKAEKLSIPSSVRYLLIYFHNALKKGKAYKNKKGIS